VRHLEKHKVPMAIATSSSARKLALKVAPKPALFAPFAARIACADDGRAEREARGDERCAGARRVLRMTDRRAVVWVPPVELLGVVDDGADAERPDETLRSLEEFVPEAWGLPAYDDA
jgi:pseudouridine-5'-monophosphatase